ncbi:MAG TPA: hypothetical protein VMU39_03695 [Solirubrobacteraceae bacterium]|nr:hypothetical protein [Solirubrobacteraceae bacterium]
MSNDYRLSYGTHATPEDGRCAMEWVSYLAGEPHSDHPACVSPVVRAFCTTLNDSLEDGPRQRLRPYLARTIGTAGDGFDEARSLMAMDWLTRTYVPRWLAVAGLTESAQHIAGLEPLLDGGELRPALDALAAARRQTRATWSATLGTPRAWAPWAAGRAAAREAAWASAGAAAWAAARVAVGDIEGDRVRAMAREIAGDSAAAVARSFRSGTGRAAARRAVIAALGPTLEELRVSALALLDRMLPTVPLAMPVVENAALVCGAADAPASAADIARR